MAASISVLIGGASTSLVSTAAFFPGQPVAIAVSFTDEESSPMDPVRGVFRYGLIGTEGHDLPLETLRFAVGIYAYVVEGTGVGTYVFSWAGTLPSGFELYAQGQFVVQPRLLSQL